MFLKIETTGRIRLIFRSILTPLSVNQYRCFYNLLPVHEGGMDQFEGLGLVIEKVADPNEKIALFCKLYEKNVGIKYKASPSDSGKIKYVQLTEAMLHQYFRSENFHWKGKYSKPTWSSNTMSYVKTWRREAGQST